MDVSQWGPRAWFFLHTVTFYYPDKPSKKDKQSINNFFNSLSGILPCEHCRNHYAAHLKKYPIESNNNSKYELTNWLIQVHNEVNISLGKKTMSYNDVIQHYKQFYSNKDTGNKKEQVEKYTCTNSCKLLGLLLVLSLVFYYFYYIRKK